MDVVQLVADFGFPVVMVIGLGYFVYFVWQTITNVIDPAVQDMKDTIIRLTDQLRLLDQDMIRLQEKVNTVIELREADAVQRYNEENKNKKRHARKSLKLGFLCLALFLFFLLFCFLLLPKQTRWSINSNRLAFLA